MSKELEDALDYFLEELPEQDRCRELIQDAYDSETLRAPPPPPLKGL